MTLFEEVWVENLADISMHIKAGADPGMTSDFCVQRTFQILPTL
jgi:hypothetical protein